MGDKSDLSKVNVTRVKSMLQRILLYTVDLKFGYVVQIVFELLSTYTAIMQGYRRTNISSFDSYVDHGIVIKLLMVRNALNHNSYDDNVVLSSINTLLKDRVVETLYNNILGSCEGYDLFETEAYLYLEYMKRLWKEV